MIQIKNFKKLPVNSGIYSLIISGKLYIGSSQCIKERVRGHRKDLIMKKHGNNFLQNLFNKYGEENLYVNILFEFEYCPLYSELLEKEKYFIDQLNPEINFKRDPITQNNCITTSKKCYQYKLTGEFLREFESVSEVKRKLKISCGFACRGNKSYYKSAGGYLWSYIKYDKYPTNYENNSSKSKIRNIKCSNGKEYSSIADCARDLFSENFNSVCASISACCRGKLKSYKNYKFSYL
jgi:hypothetical protein